MHVSYNFNSFLKVILVFLLISSGELDIIVWNCNKARWMIKTHGSYVTGWRINYSLLLIQSSSFSFDATNFLNIFFIILLVLVLNITLKLLLFLLSLYFFILFFVLRTRIINFLNMFDEIVSNSNYMNFTIESVAAASNITIETNVNLILLWILLIL